MKFSEYTQLKSRLKRIITYWLTNPKLKFIFVIRFLATAYPYNSNSHMILR